MRLPSCRVYRVWFCEFLFRIIRHLPMFFYRLRGPSALISILKVLLQVRAWPLALGKEDRISESPCCIRQQIDQWLALITIRVQVLSKSWMNSFLVNYDVRPYLVFQWLDHWLAFLLYPSIPTLGHNTLLCILLFPEAFGICQVDRREYVYVFLFDHGHF